MDIFKEYFTLRLKFYQKRKDYLEGILEAEASKLSFQAKFILEKCQGELVVENKKRKTIVDELIKRGYPPDPVKEWKIKNDDAEEEVAEEEETPEEAETASTSSSTKKPGKHF